MFAECNPMRLRDHWQLEVILESLAVLRETLGLPGGRGRDDLWAFRTERLKRSLSNLHAGCLTQLPHVASLTRLQLNLRGQDAVLEAKLLHHIDRALSDVHAILSIVTDQPVSDAPVASPWPRLQPIIEALKELQPALLHQGIARLWVFGSVARQEDHEASDLDLAFEVSPSAEDRFSLIDQARIARTLSNRLERDVDLVELNALSDAVRKRVQADMVTVFDETLAGRERRA